MIDQLDIKNLASLATFLAGAGSAVWGMLQYYSSSEKKKFAAEREFMHLKRNQEQMQQCLAKVMDELDDQGDDMKTMAACFNLLLSQSGQSISGIFAHKKRNESPTERDS